MNLGLSWPAVARATGFFALWIMLTGGNPADLGAAYDPLHSHGSWRAFSANPWSPEPMSRDARSIPGSRCTPDSWSILSAFDLVRRLTLSPA